MYGKRSLDEDGGFGGTRSLWIGKVDNQMMETQSLDEEGVFGGTGGLCIGKVVGRMVGRPRCIGKCVCLSCACILSLTLSLSGLTSARGQLQNFSFSTLEAIVSSAPSRRKG
jgi:hypothetical protein